MEQGLGLSLRSPVNAYLRTVRKLFIEHQCTDGFKKKQIFVMMIHSFMQELCGYPPVSYIVTTAAYGNAKVAGYPHVVPASYSAKPTLFYFTSSENPDDVHDLWVKHANLYFIDPQKSDIAADCATKVVFTNFFIIDGAAKDPVSGAWNLWSASNLDGARVARIDLRDLENDPELTLMMSHIIYKRLQTIQYQSPSEVRESDCE